MWAVKHDFSAESNPIFDQAVHLVHLCITLKTVAPHSSTRTTPFQSCSIHGILKTMSTVRLLLVDDHEVVRLGTKALLERHPISPSSVKRRLSKKLSAKQSPMSRILSLWTFVWPVEAASMPVTKSKRLCLIPKSSCSPHTPRMSFYSPRFGRCCWLRSQTGWQWRTHTGD